LNVLLDTNAFLYLTLNSPALTPLAVGALDHTMNTLFISPVTHWEIAIKVSVGKLTVKAPLEQFWKTMCATYHLQSLPIEVSHTSRLITLPHHHRDPFDRLLVAQALIEHLSVISSDAQLDAYGIQRIW
jgi:PIN domain nuclease of toxin-antitoxin system